MSPQSRCVVCDEAITNPICPNCLEKEMQYWILERDPFLADSFRNSGKLETETYNEETTCVICGNNMNMCAHCFCKDVLEWLTEKNTELGREFEKHFDFEIDN